MIWRHYDVIVNSNSAKNYLSKCLKYANLTSFGVICAKRALPHCQNRDQKGKLSFNPITCLWAVPGPVLLVGAFPSLRAKDLTVVFPICFFQISAKAFSEFCRRKHHNREINWCDWEGNPTNWTGPLHSSQMVSQGKAFASPRMLQFREPGLFTAGNLANNRQAWEEILADYPKRAEIFPYISSGVDITRFFIHFEGSFEGKVYNSDMPPTRSFANSRSCDAFQDFI